MNCVFCDIAGGKEKAEILFEDEHTLSFLDIRPFNYGHSLIIPKKHYENFLELPPEELRSVIHTVQIVSAALKESLTPDGYNVLSNNGSAAGQTIFHFHFHIIPRFRNDDFKFRVNLKEYSDGLMQSFAEQIRKSINQ